MNLRDAAILPLAYLGLFLTLGSWVNRERNAVRTVWALASIVFATRYAL